MISDASSACPLAHSLVTHARAWCGDVAPTECPAFPVWGNMERMIRPLVSNPCKDACGTVATGQLFDGALVYRCPGCESQWVEVPDGSRDAPQRTSSSAPTDTVEPGV